jgi:hypothetical protein
VRLRYVNGEGVQQDLEPIGCDLSENEKNFIRATAVLSDMYVLPDENLKEGETWTIYGRDVFPVVDPSVHGKMDGQIKVVRRANEGRTAIIEVQPKSRLTMTSYDKDAKYLGDWYPDGEMRFSLDEGIVSRADLGGILEVKRESTNHILFKAELKTAPSYTVTYTCKLLPKK